MSLKAVRSLKLIALACFAAPLALLMVGCPHRSPLWSPDSKHILLLARSGDEQVDRPAGGLWLVDVESQKTARLPEPSAGAHYLAAAWIDERSFVVFTALMDQGDVKEGSEAMWRGAVGSKEWKQVAGPKPSSERSPRRNPVVLKTEKQQLVVYPTGSETVAAVDLADGKVISKIEPAELIGPGPAGGCFVYRPEAETGGLELVAVGADLKPLWTKKFSALSREIGEKTGKKPAEIVINDTSTSARLGTPLGSEAAVTFVYTDVSWRDGVSGYYVRFNGKDGKVLSATSATGIWGRPGEAGGAAWAITPAAERGDAVVIRSVPVSGGDGVRIELPGQKKSSVYGYALSPTGKTFGAVFGGAKVKLVLYPVEGQRVSGKPVEIEIGA